MPSTWQRTRHFKVLDLLVGIRHPCVQRLGGHLGRFIGASISNGHQYVVEPTPTTAQFTIAFDVAECEG